MSADHRLVGRPPIGLPSRTWCSALPDSQNRGIQQVVHLFFSKLLGRKVPVALNRNGIAIQRQPERPRAIFVLGVLYVARYHALADFHWIFILSRAFEVSSLATTRC